MLPLRALNRLAVQSLLLAGACGLAPMLYALPSDQRQSVTLEADRATYNERTGITSYSGNVIITQGTIRIQADQLVVNLDSNRAIKDATAEGHPARFQQQLNTDKGLAKGEGQKVFYDAQTGVVTLTGNALLTQDGASFKGNSLRYSMNQGDIEAVGNSKRRVQLVIPPNTNPTPTSAKTQP
ncbi:MAG: lipopolysaccharide transport periplasmic protein LptA [Pseudomonadota bacterium]|jgi:lipopolysaccharide export system protein LptA